MTKVKIPANVAQATKLTTRYSDVDGRVAAIEAERARRLAKVNAEADEEAGPLVKERDAIGAAIGEWFKSAGSAELPKGRKSMQLGGCMIGTRATKSTLTIAGDEADVAAVLSGLRWAKPMLRVKTTLNRSSILSSLDGRHKVALAEMGIGRTEPEDRFFIERVEQPGTIGG